MAFMTPFRPGWEFKILYSQIGVVRYGFICRWLFRVQSKKLFEACRQCTVLRIRKAVTSDSLNGKGKVAWGGNAAPIVDLLIGAAVVMEKALVNYDSWPYKTGSGVVNQHRRKDCTYEH
jgi:hypothetical protein